ncbi:hypothetical protein ACS0TY_023437 [Phlomoides rotata]
MATAVMREVGFHPPSPTRPTSLLLHNLNPNFHLHCSPISTYGHPCLLLLSPLPLRIRRCSRWDSKAEPYSNENEDFDFDDSALQWEVLDEYIDSIWIFKVFGSYGWMLPPVLFSMLLVTGPKAFLMALALPLGQSTFAFAIERFQNRDKIKPKPKHKYKTKKGRSRSYSSRDDELEEEPEFYGSQETRTQKKGYQSWVSKSNDRSRNNFGGWDELDSQMDSVGSSRRAAQRSSRMQGTPPPKGKKKRQCT